MYVMKCIQLRKGENQQANCTLLNKTCNLDLNALFSRAYVMRLFLNFCPLSTLDFAFTFPVVPHKSFC